MSQGSRYHPPQIPTKIKTPHPSELIREAVANAKAFGEARGCGKCISDKLMGDEIILTFANGAQTRVSMPRNANLHKGDSQWTM